MLDPDRMEEFLEVYAVGLAQAIRARPHAYRTREDDTPETFALRVALTVADIVSRRGFKAILVSSDGFVNACRALRIDCTERALQNFIEGR